MIVEFRLFGGLTLIADEQPVTGAAAQPRRLAVLAVLAHAWPSTVTRDRLVGLIWPEQNESGAKRLLTQALYELRKALGDVFNASGRDVGLNADKIVVDLIAFRAAARDSSALDRAAELYRGPFLDGFHLRDATEFERWVSTARDDLARELDRVIELALSQHAATSNARELLRWAERAVSAAPFNSRAVIRYMELAEKAGDPAAARRAHSAYERRMREELGLEPDEGVTRIAAGLGVPARPADSSVLPRVRPIDPSQSVRAEGTPERSYWRSVVAFCVVMVAVVVASWSAWVTRAPLPTSRVVALKPFDGKGDPDATHLSSMLSAMLVADLDGSSGARVDSGVAVNPWGELRGLLVVTKEQIRIDGELAIPGEQRVVRASVTGPRDSLPALAERLSVELLPALYPVLGDAFTTAGRLPRIRAARNVLDGELALRRGAFEEAYQLFRDATEVDSTAAYAWYRRAVAAEDAHRIDDADRAAVLADENRGTLSPRDQQVIHAYAVWRAGDARGADSLYRRVLETRPNDADVWFHFAEVAYHGGPLTGRPLDAARDPWRRALALDTGNVPALMHAIRLEARARSGTASELLRRARALGASDPFISEAALIVDASRSATLDARKLAEMPDASLHFVHALVAGFLERPEVARQVAVQLTQRDRSDATRADGYNALAHLALTQGDRRRAATWLDSASRMNPALAASTRAYFATLPFARADSLELDAARRALRAISATPTSAPLYLELSVDERATAIIRDYLEALVSGVPSSLHCDTYAAVARDLCTDLSLGLLANDMIAHGKEGEALRALERMNLRVPYQLAGRSAFFARTRERFLRARLLERSGRLGEAYDWYTAVPHAARFDYVYLGATHVARGRIRERQGDRRSAAVHYQRALALFASPDSGFAELRREAETGLQRTR